mmetsp:Transcript_107568/g.312840  ORF Transcript_107568/g.312840 Transcript_107568/m.312840 type:complete len:89 (+) Transcript_107568:137-403(+)
MGKPSMSLHMPSGPTKLGKAAQDGDLDRAERAIRAGASVHVKDEDGWSPLHYACSNGRVAMAEALIEKHGANVDATDQVQNKANGGWG